MTVGSAALPHLRFLNACLWTLGLLAGVVAVGPGPGSPAVRVVSDGIVEMPVFLVARAGAVPGQSAPGRVVDLPADGDTVLLTAVTGNSYRVRFGTTADWQGWITLEATADDSPDLPATSASAEPGAEGSAAGVSALGPLRVPAGATRFELVLVSGSPEQVTLTFLTDVDAPAGDGPWPLVKGARQTLGSTVQPAVMPRSNWATEGWATSNPGCGSGPDYAERIQAAVIHHTVTVNTYSPDEVDDILRAVYYAHVHINGWCDVGYNFLVDRFGTIWEGRTGGVDLPVVGGHAKGFNTSTVGIAMLGQYQPGVSPSAVRPSEATRAAVAQLAAWKLSLYGVDPAGTTWLKNRSSDGPQRWSSNEWHLVPTIMGHRDLGLTSCPGDYGYEMVHGLVPDLTASRPADEPPVVANWAPYANGAGLVTVNRRGGVRPAGSAALPGMGEPTGGGATIEPLPSPPPVAVAATGEGTTTSGWVLHGDGVLQAFGGAPDIAQLPAGSEMAVDAVAAGSGGWVLSAQGGVHGFGGQSDRPVVGSGQAIIRGDLNSTGDGYLVEASGHLRAVGSAPDRQLGAAVSAVDVAVQPSGDGGWVLSGDGRLHPFGGAPSATISSPSRPPAGRSYRAVVAAASGLGGWVMTDDGQLWPFGDERLVLPVSTDTSRADAVDAAVVAPATPSGFLAGADSRWLAKASRLFLGREPSNGELDRWDGRLFYEGGRLTITQELARSDEWAGTQIDQLYQDVLGRPADPAGRQYWLTQIRAGLSLQQLGVNFYGSTEYVLTSGSTAAYVQRLYQAILSRGADAGGLAYWTSQLGAGGARPPDVASGFYRSPESRGKRVTNLYQLVLKRDPDVAGFDFWVQRLLVVDDVALAAELGASAEFYLTP